MSKRKFHDISPNSSKKSPKSGKKKVRLKKNKTKSKELNLDSIQVPLSNKFDSLSDDEDISDKTQKPVKIAPIVMTNVNIDINKILSELKLHCEVKITSIGRKIFPATAEDKNTILTALKSNKLDFFSHPDNEHQIFKAILTGLPEIDTEIIIDTLKNEHNITPLKVTMFNTSALSKIYLCHFNKKEVNMKTLGELKSVYYHRIRWQPFKPKNKGPTQCYRCAMYGHGISSCNRYVVCMLCSGNHLTNTCTVITKEQENPAYKCFNCASAKLRDTHKANDINCPFRAKYVATMDRVKGKYKQTANNETKSFNASVHSHNRNQAQPQQPPIQNVTYAAAVSHSSHQMRTNQPTESFQPTHSRNRNTATNESGDLWTFTEVAQLLMSTINELKQCKSKHDQVIVIAKLIERANE